ncbi:MAG TPA: hypothetical protein VFM01_12800 [Nakamurella sp.]|nr:hypothetical protein [Nakamurella sp.]
MDRPRRTRRNAGRGARRLAAVGALVSALVLGAGVAVAAPSASGVPAVTGIPVGAHNAAPSAPATTATTVTTEDHTLTVTVSPYQDMPPSGAQITVTGTGYDPANDLWIAVCQADGVAPMALINCVGGAIPDQNTTTGWGVVTGQGKPPYPGPVTARWKDGGSFSLTLQMPAVISESADCVSAPCAVYTRSSDDTDRTEDVAVPVTFTAPPATTTSSSPTTSSQQSTTTTTTSTTTSSSPTTTLQPSTQTLGPVPTTVTPDSMLQTSVTAGAAQTVVFTGFEPGEKVDVTLYSDPVTLPQATADPGGNVRISFEVPKDLPPGEHLLQAIGQQSGRVGIARFTVGAAATTSASASPTTSTSTAPSPSTQTQAVSSAVTSQEPSTTASQPATTTAATVTTAASSAAVTPGGAGGGNKLLWLWIALAVLVIVGGAAGAVAMVRNRRETEDDIPLVAAGAPVPPAPGWTAAPPAGGPTGGTQPGDVPTGGFGLLSGREHPDGPGLYGGGAAWPDQPTRVLGQDGPTQVMGPGGRPGPGAEPGPATQQWRPDFTGQQPAGGASGTPGGAGPGGAGPGAAGPGDAGPGGAGAGPGADQGPATQQWRPDFTGQQRPDTTGRQGPQDGDEPPGGRHHR